MKVSIITPSFNQGHFIEQTIRSVQSQRGVEVEHIVVDGGSTDCTLDILRKNPHVTWTSEPDKGQADALNKGFARASGDIVGWLNSDDLYAEDILGDMVAQFEDPTVGWVIGGVTTLYESTGTLVAEPSPRVSLAALLEDPDIVRQQPAFFRRALLEKVGGWNERFFMVMDFDLWIRLVRIVPPVMIDEQWAFFRIHTGQKTSRKNVLRQLSELVEVMAREGASRDQVRRLKARRWVAYAKASIKDLLIRCRLISRKYESRPLRLRRPNKLV